MYITIATGHLTSDATTRTVKVNGADTLVTDFTVASNEGFGDTQRTQFIRCSIWRDRGAKLQQYLTKGRSVTVRGAIGTQAWLDKEGKPRSQLTMSNPAVELNGKRPDVIDDEVPFEPDETVD